jgi:hypothetical protein
MYAAVSAMTAVAGPNRSGSGIGLPVPSMSTPLCGWPGTCEWHGTGRSVMAMATGSLRRVPVSMGAKLRRDGTWGKGDEGGETRDEGSVIARKTRRT